MLKKLIVCEKNTIARTFAKVLNLKQGLSFKSPYNFFENKEWAVLSTNGHFLEFCFNELTNNWFKVNAETLITKSVYLRFKNDCFKKILIKLQNQLKDYDSLILALDNDQQGECIGLLFLKIFFEKELNKHYFSIDQNFTQFDNLLKETSFKIKRLRLNSINNNTIIRALDNIDNFKSLPFLAEVTKIKHLFDLYMGASFTRYFSVKYNYLKKNQTLSVGRVQTALLSLIDQRTKLIKNFKPLKRYQYFLELNKEFIFRSQILEEPFKFEGPGEINFEIQIDPKEYLSPRPLNTDSYLQLMSKLQITSEVAMKNLETLYLRGYSTYPRTANQTYPKNFDYLSKISKLDQYSKPLKNNSCDFSQIDYDKRPTRGKFEKDHLPIYLLNKDPRDLESNLLFCWQALLNHFKMQFLKNTLYNHITFKITYKTIEFTFNKNLVTQKGGFKVPDTFEETDYQRLKNFLEKKLTNCKTIDLSQDIKLEESFTRPPPYYNETMLLKLMENHKIGTKSTRFNMIKLLKERYYLDKSLKITSKGEFLINILKEKNLTKYCQSNFTRTFDRELEQAAKTQSSQSCSKLFFKYYQELKEDILVNLSSKGKTPAF